MFSYKVFLIANQLWVLTKIIEINNVFCYFVYLNNSIIQKTISIAKLLLHIKPCIHQPKQNEIFFIKNFSILSIDYKKE